MRTGARRSQATDRALGGARLRAGLTGRRGRSGRYPGIASRAGGAGLTGRNRKGGVASLGASGVDHLRMVTAHLWFGAVRVFGVYAFPVSTRFRSLCIHGPDSLSVLVHPRPSCVSGLSGQFHQPGMKCQVMRPRDVVALQEQLLAGPRRVMGGTRGVWRGDVGIVVAAGTCWLPLGTFLHRCACEPGLVDHRQPNGAWEWRG
jgi:hypothetical protein